MNSQIVSEKILIKDVLIVTMDKAKSCFWGTIGIVDGKIGFLDCTEDLPQSEWNKATELNHPSRCIALPGFLDGHMHVTYLLWRYDGKSGQDRAKCATPIEKLGLIQRTRREAINAGVTFLADFAPYDDGVLDNTDKQLLGLHAVIQNLREFKLGGYVRVRLPEDKQNGNGKLDIEHSKEHLAETIELVRDMEGGSPIRLFVHPPVERKPKYRDEVLKSYADVLEIQRENPLVWIHAHCCEFARTARYAQRAFQGRSSVEVLDDYGLLHERTLLAHCIHCSDTDLDLIKDRKARVLTVPKFTDGCLARIGAMLDMGIRVGLCSDAYTIDPLNRIIHGYHLHRRFATFRHGSRPLTPIELLEMATIGAAKVFNLDEEMGSIEKGKRANIVLLDLTPEVFEPFWNPEFWKYDLAGAPQHLNWQERIAKLIHCGSVSCRDICTVIINGEQVT